MANIKFSQFTVGNTESDIDFVVGYKGANNIQISPTNLLAASLSGYLPLTGGTMTAGSSVLFLDNSFLRFGTSADATIYHDATNTYFKNFTGDLILQNNKDDKDIIFQCDDGSGGLATYFACQGSGVETLFYKRARWADNVKAQFGASADLEIYHNATDSVIENNVGDLYITNKQDNGDIIFRNDDGSGAFTEYFRVDGGVEQVIFTKEIKTVDNVKIKVGGGGDLQIFHDGSNSFIRNNNTNLIIKNDYNDGDIIFESDDGSGNIAEYFRLDGGNTNIVFSENLSLNDNVNLGMGNSGDYAQFHNGTNTYLSNGTGDFYIRNQADDKDIIFQADNGSGGNATYFLLDGSIGSGTGSVFTRFPDNSRVVFGTSSDLQIYHNGSNSLIENNTGNLNIINYSDDQDIIFRCDDGSGGIAEYFRVDGSSEKIVYSRNQWLTDGVRAVFGSSDDLQMFHNATNSYIENNTGDLLLVNYANDKDIQFYSDDGSGGTTEYFRLDGSNTNMNASKTIVFNDNVKASFGDSEDLKILHNGTDSVIINERGNLEIQQRKDDGDIIFKNDDGGGGLITYFLLDGSLAAGSVPVTRFPDNSKLGFGDSTDLQIYHNGSHSYIDETGSGSLFVRADDSIEFKSYSADEFLARFISNDRIELYFNGSKKLETRSTGIKITGVSEYADNTAAIAGGLTTGDVYRTGDLLKIVH